MRFFNNKLSRINFVILMLILPYLYKDMSNSSDSSGISKAALSVVNIIASNTSALETYQGRINQPVVGSGIIISKDGYIVTNLHVINGQKKINSSNSSYGDSYTDGDIIGVLVKDGTVKFSKNVRFLKFIIFFVKLDFELNFSILEGQK